MKKPFIELFPSYLGYYFYDVICSQLLETTKDVYNLIKEILETEDEEYFDYLINDQRINDLRSRGFLSSNRLDDIKHPETDYIEYYLQDNVRSLTLQITQDCNFRCSYCAFTSGDETGLQRTHQKKNMNYERAVEAVNFYLERSSDIDTLSIGFYGGEPLLKLDMIEKIVRYVEETSYKKCQFNITTNGSILNDRVAELWIKYNFNVLISLDGCKQAHDKNRKYVNGNGTYDSIVRNLNELLNKYPELKEKIFFNTVVDATKEIDCYNQMFADIGSISKSNDRATLVNKQLSKFNEEMTQDFLDSYEYTKFLTYMMKLNRIKESVMSPLVEDSFKNLGPYIESLEKGDYGLPQHPAGPCIAGSDKLFVDIEGNLFACEKCSETSKLMKIGSLSSGFDVNQIKYLLNIGCINKDRCLNCWATKFCSICAASCDDGNKIISPETKQELCKKVINNVKYAFYSMITMKEMSSLSK